MQESKRAATVVAETEIEKKEWPHPFSEAELASWKKQYGDKGIQLATVGKDKYVIRGLGRKEFKEIANQEYKNEDEMENAFVTDNLLYPTITLSELRAKPGAVIPSLFEKIMAASNIETNKQYIPVEMPQMLKDISEKTRLLMGDITQADVNQWFGHYKQVFYEITENKVFIYHGLRRSDFEKFRDAQRKGEHAGPTSEEALVTAGIIFPFNMDPSSNSYLQGTITNLSNLIYAASGFNTTVTVEVL